MQKSSWHYWQQWRQRFSLQRDVHFDQGILSNDYCRDCRYCCGPQDCATPFPMKLLPSQQHAHLERDFFLLAPDTACLDDRGCKSCGPEGCLLPRQRRPVACSLFPLVLLDTGLYLYKICPAVFFLPLDRWLVMAREAVNWLVTLAPEAARHPYPGSYRAGTLHRSGASPVLFTPDAGSRASACPGLTSNGPIPAFLFQENS